MPFRLKAGFQKGFILLPVVMTLTLIAAVAFLINREGAMAVNELGSDVQSTQAALAAKAGINHMLWQANNANCTGYNNLAATAFGANSYSATISQNQDKTANITAVGVDASGASYTISRDRVTLFQPYKTMTLQLGTDPGKDATIASGNSNTNYGSDDNAILKLWLFSWFYRNQLIQFDINKAIPANAHIISAQLQLYQKSGSGSGDIEVHRITQSWVEGTKSGSGTADGATWKTYNGTNAWAANGGDYAAPPVTANAVKSGSGIVNFEIAPLAQDWLSGKYPNNGVLLRTDDSLSVTFAAKEDATVSNRPKLIITYACKCGELCALSKKVYWTDDLANKIQMSNEDGSQIEDLVTGLDRPTGLDVDPINKKLYWTNNLQINRANLDGTAQETLYNGILATLDIKLDVAGGKMYWTHDNPISQVMRANLDGSGSQIINTSLSKPAYLSLDVSAGKIYMTNFGSGTVARMNLDGSALTNLVSSQGSPVGNAVDSVNGKIYWSAGSAGNWIRRSNLDGSNPVTIVNNASSPQDIAFDIETDRIYWTDSLAKTVKQASSDGSNPTTLVATGLNRPRGIVLADASLIGKNRTRTLNPLADTDIYEGSQNVNFGTAIDIVAGRDIAGKQDKILIRFDLSGLPAGAAITSAKLRLNLVGSFGTGSYNIGLYKIIRSWQETTANWSNFSSGGNFDSTQLAVTSVLLGSTGFKEWNVPVAIVNGWMAAPSSNYGLVLVYESTTKGPDFQFASKENTTVSARPQLVINYTLP